MKHHCVVDLETSFLNGVNEYGNGWELLSDMLCLPDPKAIFSNPIISDLLVLQSN
jgi:hypothetical protein